MNEAAGGVDANAGGGTGAGTGAAGGGGGGSACCCELGAIGLRTILQIGH